MDEENIDLENLDRERLPDQNNEEEETSFIDDNDESVLVIDGSNPNYTRVDDDKPSTSRIPDARRDARDMKRSMNAGIKVNIKKWLGVTINKGDGPNSTLVYDNLRFTYGKNEEPNGAVYKGKKKFNPKRR